MQIEPEQWAEALWEKCVLADLYYTPAGKPDPMEMPAGIIQRAFEDRERKLRDALESIERETVGVVPEVLNLQMCIHTVNDVAHQALKETRS